ncbi:MAG: hypothetical protein NVS9B4_11080 [Candidatus Acidiferrum sp.]
MRVLIVDDHEVVRRGVRHLLWTVAGVVVCGEAEDGLEAIAKAQELKPDIITMDISMPKLNGLEATREIKRILPQIEILILSQHDVPEMMKQALNAGASGYVVKSAISTALVAAIEKVRRGETSFDATIFADKETTVDTQEILQRTVAFEKALRNSEEQLRMAMDAGKLGAWDWDIPRNKVSWTDRIYEFHGLERGAFDGTVEAFAKLVHPDDRERVQRLLEDALNKRVPYEVEFRTIRPSGEVRWLFGRAEVFRDNAGVPIRMLGIVHDITERKQAEQAVHESEQQFRVLADSIPELCWMARPDGHIFWYNQRWYEYTGTRPQQMEGWGWQSVHDPKVLPEVLEKWHESIATGQAFEMVFPLRSAAGEFRTFLTRVRPLKDASGNVLRWFGTNTDITAQKRVEDALRQSEERLRAAFSQTYSFLALLEVDGTIIEINRAAQEAAGCTREELVGRKFWERWWARLPEETAILKASIARAAKGESVREEGYFCLPDGTRRFADRTLSPVKDESGRVTMVVATGLDITEQKELRDKLEARVMERTRELEEKNKVLQEQAKTVRELSGRLLRSQDEERRRIAREMHDGVGQVVAAVAMNIPTIAKEKDKLSPDAARSLEEIGAMVQEISAEIRTVSYLLHPPLLDEVGLESALRWYVEGFAERSKIGVALELSSDLGRLSQDQELALFRVVQECLTNIHRHSGSSTATVRLSRNDKEARLEVKDDGKGMSGKTQSEISSGESRGVGLRGMRERVRQIGGALEVQSNGDGTLVTVALPLSSSANAAKVESGTATA